MVLWMMFMFYLEKQTGWYSLFNVHALLQCRLSSRTQMLIVQRLFIYTWQYKSYNEIHQAKYFVVSYFDTDYRNQVKNMAFVHWSTFACSCIVEMSRSLQTVVPTCKGRKHCSVFHVPMLKIQTWLAIILPNCYLCKTRDFSHKFVL